MNQGKLFIKSEVPYPFSKQELNYYFKKMSNGDLDARKEIITHNIRFVINEVLKKYSQLPCDKEELIAMGLIALIKSVDTFDYSKNIQFMTYATTCIRNEILTFLRAEKKYQCMESLNKTFLSKGEEEVTIENILPDETSNFVRDYEKEECYQKIREIIANLPKRSQVIMINYFGFYYHEPMTQAELAKFFGVTQSYISRTIQATLRKISIYLQIEGMIELHKKPARKRKK